SVGGSAELALQYDPAQWPQRLELAQRLGGVESLLAIAQILDQTLVRMRTSTHARVLLELAMIRICALERLDELADVIRQLRSGGGVAIPSAPRAASTSTPVRGASPAPHLPPVEKSSAEKEKKK